MSLKILPIMFLMLFAISFVALAQKDEEEDIPVFGDSQSRGLTVNPNVHNLGEIATDSKVEVQFRVINNQKSEMNFEDPTNIDAALGVVVVKKTVKPGEMGLINVTVNASMINGSFDKRVAIKSTYKNETGIVVSKVNSYTVKGIVKKTLKSSAK